MSKNETIKSNILGSNTLGMSHTLAYLEPTARSLARVMDYCGQYVCAHSAPSAWYGIVVDASIDAGVICLDLADAGLWTQGMTKDLIRPGQRVTEDLQSRRDGVVTVTALTAIQPAGAFFEGIDKLKDDLQLRDKRCVPPALQGTSLEDFAKFMGQEPGQTAAAVLEVYHKMVDRSKKKDDANLRGNFAGVINLVRDYAATKDFPIRGTASIVLHGGRKYMW